MKYIKMLGLLAVSAAAFMAFATTASADTLTGGSGNVVTSIHATANGHVILDTPFGRLECSSTVAGIVTSQGAGKDIKGNITTLDFTNCTGGDTVTVLNKGTLTLDVTATNLGTLSSLGAAVTITDHALGVSCLYETDPVNGTHIGTVTGGTGAKLHIDSASIPRVSHSFFCGSTGEWTGSYTVISPHTLHLDAS